MATPREKSTPKETPSEDHERDEIEFVDALPDELKCSICLLVFKDPILTDCGHLFCQTCIAPVVSRNARCPLCNEEGFRTFPDKRTIRKIRSLKIKCKKRAEGCEWVGEYGRLEHHLDPKEGDCGFVEVECDFYSVGCTTRPLRKDLSQHMEANTHKHLFLMSNASMKAGSETERQLQERRAELLQQQLQKKEEDTQKRFKEKDEQIKALQVRVESLEEQLQKKEEKDAQIKALQGRVESLEEQLQKNEDTQQQFKDEQIKALQGRVESLEERLHTPPCVASFPGAHTPCDFILHDFSKHRAADDEWLSPPFYSHLGGYRQRLTVYANGHGQYKGTQVSFVHYTMQGEYDDQLEWPRKLDNCIRLLNHNTGIWGWDVGCTCSSKCTKPKTAQERRTCWHFCKNSNLDPYLKDDCIHFRVTSL